LGVVGNMKSTQSTILNFVMNQVKVNLNVLGAFVEDWISSDVDGYFFITKRSAVVVLTWRFERSI